jgi:hypothetical protein
VSTLVIEGTPISRIKIHPEWNGIPEKFETNQQFNPSEAQPVQSDGEHRKISGLEKTLA